jgi:ribosomal protein L21E
MMKDIAVGDRVRIIVRGSRYKGRIGNVIGICESGEYQVELNGLSGSLFYKPSEIELAFPKVQP